MRTTGYNIIAWDDAVADRACMQIANLAGKSMHMQIVYLAGRSMPAVMNLYMSHNQNGFGHHFMSMVHVHRLKLC